MHFSNQKESILCYKWPSSGSIIFHLCRDSFFGLRSAILSVMNPMPFSTPSNRKPHLLFQSIWNECTENLNISVTFFQRVKIYQKTTVIWDTPYTHIRAHLFCFFANNELLSANVCKRMPLCVFILLSLQRGYRVYLELWRASFPMGNDDCLSR